MMESARAEDRPGARCSPAAHVSRWFCFRCGYDLYGLALPHACPECGCICDPVRDEEDARRWFADAWCSLRWITRRSRTPVALCYALNDPMTGRLARQRRMVSLWVPAIMTSFVVMAGVLVLVEYDVKVAYYDKSDLDQSPLRVTNTEETDRLYSLNLHLFRGGLFFRQPATWGQTVEKTRTGLLLDFPHRLEPLVLLWGGAPLLALLCGYLPARYMVVRSGRRAATVYSQPKIETAMQAASSLTAPVMGVVFWIWLIAVVTRGLLLVCFPAAAWIGWYLILGSGVGWLVVSVAVWPALIMQDCARKIFPSRRPACVVLVVITVVGPVAAFCGLAKCLD